MCLLLLPLWHSSLVASALSPTIQRIPAFVNIGSLATITGTSLTIGLPGNRINGNLLIAATTIRDTRIPVWPAGWTAVGAGNEFAYRVIDGTETNPTVTWTGSSTQDGIILQYGPVSASGVGAKRENQAQTGTPATDASITTTANNSLVVGVVISASATTTPGNSSGFTSDASNLGTSAIRSSSVFEATSGTASPAISSSVDTAVPWRAVLLELLAP